MIIVDDGSSDETQNGVMQFAATDERIRFIPTDGVGRGRALNLALSLARADLVANIDADDPCHPCRLEIQLRALQSNREFGVLGTETVLIYDSEMPVWQETVKCLDFAIRDVTNDLMFRNPINHSSVVMRRSVLEEVGGYSSNRRSQFDYDLWVKIAEAGYRLGIIDKPLASKRIHRGQSFENKARLHYLFASAEVQARAIRSLGGGLGAWVGLTARMCWGLLPLVVRNRLRQHIRI